MSLTATTIDEAVITLQRLLELQGKLTSNQRTKKQTKEVIGVTIRIRPNSPQLPLLVEPEHHSANLEIFSTFAQAAQHLVGDETARYAVGRPMICFNKKIVMPCVCLVQILKRQGNNHVVVYFRSQDIKELRADLTAIVHYALFFCPNPTIILHIGSLHKYVT
jgi:hypothetical protein